MERPVRRLTNVVDTAHVGKFINTTTFRTLCLDRENPYKMHN